MATGKATRKHLVQQFEVKPEIVVVSDGLQSAVDQISVDCLVAGQCAATGEAIEEAARQAVCNAVRDAVRLAANETVSGVTGRVADSGSIDVRVANRLAEIVVVVVCRTSFKALDWLGRICSPPPIGVRQILASR